MVELSSKEVANLKSRAHDVPVAMQIGKAGLTEGVVQEVLAHLEREPLVKIKLLKAALEEVDKREFSERLAQATGAVLVEVRGFTAVLYKPSRGRRAK